MPPGVSAPLIACLQLSPWPLTLLTREHPGPVAVLSETTRRVVHVSPEARLGGVEPGMRAAAALSRVPELHAEVVTAPRAQAAWNELLELLYARFSDRVEGRAPGTAFLRLGVAGARELAAALHAPVGLARSVELAHLAALRAVPGEVRDVPAEPGGQAERAFLLLSPTAHLHVLGLTAAHIDRLRFLGHRGLADLEAWSPGQREAFLGVDAGGRVNRFLRGQRTLEVGRHQPGQVIEAALGVDRPLQEPAEVEAALDELLPAMWAELRGRTAAYLTVSGETVGGTLGSTRRLKWPLDPSALGRLALTGLVASGALALGVDRLRLQLSGLVRPGRMVGLWPGLAELEVTETVLGRFPEALVRVHWLDPFAYVSDARYEWVDWLTGAVRATPLTPPPPAPVTHQERHARAVSRVLAFFEDARP